MHILTLVYTCHSGDITLCLLALTSRYEVVLQGHLLFVDHFNEINYFTFPLLYPVYSKGPCDRLRDTGTPSGRKRKIAELSSYDT